MKPYILILGKNYSTALGVIRSLGKEEYHIDVFYITNQKGASKKVACSKYVKECTEFIGRIDKNIIEELLSRYACAGNKYFLLPTDDYTSSLIDRYRDELSSCFFMPYIEGKQQGAITELMDKSVQSELARKHGLPTVKEWILSLEEEKIQIPADISFPCFVKPLLSARGYKREIGMCATYQELEEKLRMLQSAMRNRSIMIQEFLNIDQEYSMSGVCLDQEVILPALIKKLVVGQRERGVSIVGQIVELKEIGELENKLLEFLKSIHYYGMFDIDLMKADGIIYFGELNLRSSGTGYAIQKAGVNLPDIFVSAVSGNPDWKNKNRNVAYGMRFFYDKTAWEDYQSNYITREKLRSYQKASDFSLIMDHDDKAPGKLFLREMKLKIYKSQIKKRILYFVGRKGK